MMEKKSRSVCMLIFDLFIQKKKHHGTFAVMLEWFKSMARATWLAFIFIAVAAWAYHVLPPKPEVLRKGAEAFMIAGAVELLFQVTSIRRFIAEMFDQILNRYLKLEDSALRHLTDGDVRTIKKRLTERLIGAKLRENSLYDTLESEVEEMLAAPYAEDTIVVRVASACTLGGRPVWRVDHTTRFHWCNHTDCVIKHPLQLRVTLEILAEGRDPLEEPQWSIDGKVREVKSHLTADGKTMVFEASGEVIIPKGGRVEVVQKDVRFIPIDDRFTYTSATPHNGMTVHLTFDHEVHPRIDYFGYKAKEDTTIYSFDKSCVLIARGWHLPDHVLMATWEPIDLTDWKLPEADSLLPTDTMEYVDSVVGALPDCT